MKALIYTAITAFALVFAAGALSADLPHANWKARMAYVGNDLPAFLHYSPTDGASRGGEVRQAMHLTNIQR